MYLVRASIVGTTRKGDVLFPQFTDLAYIAITIPLGMMTYIA